MIHRFSAFLVLTLIYLSGYGQTFIPTFEIRNDTAWKHSLPDSMVLFIFDSTGKMDLTAAMISVQNGKIKPWRSEYAKEGLEKGKYWFFYRLSNKTGRQYEAGLDAYSNVANFYIVRPDQKTEILTTGNKIPWSKKKEFRFSNVAVFTLKNNETADIYYHAEISDITFIKSFRIDVLNPNSFARKYLADNEPFLVRKEQQNFSFSSGIYLTAAAIYFVFFFLVREKVFLYFALFLLCLFVPTSPFLTSISRVSPSLASASEVFTVIAFTSFMHFIRQYLNLKKNLPVWDKFVFGFSIIFLILGSYEILITKNSGTTLVIVLMVIFVLSLITTFFLLRNRQQTEKKFLLYAVLPFLIVFPIVVIAAIILTVTGPTDFILGIKLLPLILDSISTLVELSFIWMIISFSRLLFRRFTEQRQKIREQQLEKEQILLEKEQEKLRLIEKQKEDLEIQVAERTAELKTSLENLKATQAQLIQSEKMASLGEMTAGIAHEIQNPLNFVNNFAEVNGEILQELKDEIGKILPDQTARENLEALILDLSSNQEKIKTHGKRADSIVKNMLQHSRSGTSQKEDTDLNSLIDEYVKLSFHGMRAKDKSFNSDFQIHLDPAVNNVPILTQDFGRVILNLANNAFYAVSEKKRSEEDHKPMVQVKTSRINGTIRIIVSDNGNGISDKIKDKIFQPFFTTKPSGEGTGLGLSISYDIITKGHGGKMWVESKEGEGTSFIIEIPV